MLQAKDASSSQRDASMALTTLLFSSLSRSIRSQRHVQPQQCSFTTASYPSPPPRRSCMTVPSVHWPWPPCSRDAQISRFLRSENISSTPLPTPPSSTLCLTHSRHYALLQSRRYKFSGMLPSRTAQ